ncbi:uncharacterized protein LOC115629208 [Scaptodrosophila lebanonensis]|uniref:Uncharacterized protein LOC115629208 n=1 Tax=Drosophila lebanonensis TaxID=7225 RepID=A0A6J2U1W2_DROLE|nr:uncharacterized protein LOC115629208 [Scaptodrosophila lebanonensis]
MIDGSRNPTLNIPSAGYKADDIVSCILDNYNRSTLTVGSVLNNTNAMRDDSSCSEDGTDNQSVQFYLGSIAPSPAIITSEKTRPLYPLPAQDGVSVINDISQAHSALSTTSAVSVAPMFNALPASPTPSNTHATSICDSTVFCVDNGDCGSCHSPSVSSERSVTAPPRAKKQMLGMTSGTMPAAAVISNTTCPSSTGRAPLPPPRKATQRTQKQKPT